TSGNLTLQFPVDLAYNKQLVIPRPAQFYSAPLLINDHNGGLTSQRKEGVFGICFLHRGQGKGSPHIDFSKKREALFL
ncbi:MAG TPA: hypothetical protein PKL00_08200, partial [Bacillota bacterium]|nr:hypothetical protein [Bacillota bacterium]